MGDSYHDLGNLQPWGSHRSRLRHCMELESRPLRRLPQPVLAALDFEDGSGAVPVN